MMIISLPVMSMLEATAEEDEVKTVITNERRDPPWR